MDANKDAPAVRLTALLKDKLLPKLAREGVFGEGWLLDTADITPIGGLGQDHWMSTTLITQLELSKAGEKRSVPVVSKCMLPSDGFDEYSHPDLLSSNEVCMYREVFPFFEHLAASNGVRIDDLYPKTYLAEGDVEGMLSLTLMENLRAGGFRLATERTALDRQHVNLALRAIGRMHALSYAAKARSREEFLQRVTPLLREACYLPDARTKWTDVLHKPFTRGLNRATARLEKATESDKVSVRKKGLLRLRSLGEDLYSIMERAAAVHEPMSVIVHGDFCRNNMQFRYDEDGKPVEVCFFDFQTSRYCTPVVDLSFFLFLNTSPALRQAHWDDLLQEYFGSLKSTLDQLLEGHDVHRDFVMPTLEGLHADLKEHALWGYVICAFFLPQMMLDPTDVPDFSELKERVSEDFDATMDFMSNMGGETATEALADMVLEFLDRDLLPQVHS